MTKKELNEKILKFQEFKNEEEWMHIQKEKTSREIIEFLKKKEMTEYSFNEEKLDDSCTYDIKVISPLSVTFDADKIESKVDSELCKQFILKQYEITDMAGLISYLKSCGVDPKKFKKFIDVKKKVDTKKLDNLTKIGEIDEDDLKGCYSVKEGKSYLKVTKKELER